MTNLVDIQLQIEKLQKQASQIQAKEFHKTIREIREKMQAFDVTIEDLQSAKVPTNNGRGMSSDARSAGQSKKSGSSMPVPAKYRGPEGQTWTGRGLMPRWMAGLVAAGRQKDEFLIAT